MKLPFFLILLSSFFSVFGQSSTQENYDATYQNYYDSVFNHPPFLLIKEGLFFENTIQLKETLLSLTSISIDNSDNAITEYLVSQAEEYYSDSIFMGKHYTQLALHYWNSGLIDSSLYYDVQSIEILSAKNSRFIYEPYFSIAQSYRDLDSTELSIKYGLKAYQAINNKTLDQKDSIGLVHVSYFLFSTFSKKIELQQLATFYYNKLVKISNLLGDYESIYLADNIKMQQLIRENKLDSAVNLALEDLNFIEKNNFPKYIGNSLLNIGAIYHEIGKYDSAIIFYDSAINQKYYNPQITLTALEYKIYSGENPDLKNNLQNFLIYRDSLDNLENKKNIALITTKFETKEIQNKNVQLEKDLIIQKTQLRNRNYLIITIFIFLFLFIFWLVERRKRRRLQFTNKILKTEHKLLRTQMGPHFIFNSLASIQHIIHKGENEKAEKEINDFSKIMRKTLDHSRLEYIEIEDEIETLSHYLEFQKSLSESVLEYRLTIDPLISEKDILIPPMLIQPFIENAIKYGKLINGINTVTINFIIKENVLHIEVINNGNWINKSSNYISHSINITKERIAILNKNKKDYIGLSIEKGNFIKIDFTIKIKE